MCVHPDSPAENLCQICDKGCRSVNEYNRYMCAHDEKLNFKIIQKLFVRRICQKKGYAGVSLIGKVIFGHKLGQLNVEEMTFFCKVSVIIYITNTYALPLLLSILTHKYTIP